MAEDDCAPRIRELRAQQSLVQKTRDEIRDVIASDAPDRLDTSQLIEYTKDFRALLAEGTITEQKAFLRSFIKRIDYEPGKVAISYTIPMPVEENRMATDEVLSMEPNGEPRRTRTSNRMIKSHLLFQLS